MLYLMGSVKSVTANVRTLVHDIEVEDTAVAILEFECGAVGMLTGATSVTSGYPRMMSIHGEKGSITLTEDRVTRWDVEGSASLVDTEQTTLGASRNPTDFSVELRRRQLSDFIDALEQGRAPMLDQHAGRRPVDLILAIYYSSKVGKTVFMA